jgi:hypothetical protein
MGEGAVGNNKEVFLIYEIDRPELANKLWLGLKYITVKKKSFNSSI